MLSERTKDPLRDTLEDAARIATFIDGMTQPEFVANERTLFAVERPLQRITEAALQIETADAERIRPSLPIAEMRGLRNRLRHEYRDLDRSIIFDIARIEVPAVAVAAELALESDGD